MQTELTFVYSIVNLVYGREKHITIPALKEIMCYIFITKIN